MNGEKKGTATAAVERIEKCQDRRISKRSNVNLHTLNLYEQSPERLIEKHDRCSTSGYDWIKAIENNAADRELFLNAGHEIDENMKAKLVHGSTRNDLMDTLEEPSREGNELPFGHACKHQRASTSFSLVFLLLSEVFNEKHCDRILYFLRKNLQYLQDFLSIYQSFSVICRERECCDDAVGPDCCFTLEDGVCRNRVW